MGDTNQTQKTRPIEFNLFDDDDEQILAIADDSAGRNLNLEIQNTSRYPVNFARLVSQTAGASHFELKFRPGVLAAAALDKLSLGGISLNDAPLNAKDWNFAHKSNDDGTVSILFSAVKPLAEPLAPGANLRFALKNIVADRSGGSRGTRVELKYGQLVYDNSNQTFINGSGIRHMSIVNVSGKKESPFYVSFVGSNTILNDGNDNERILQITSLSKDDTIPLSTGDDSTKLVLSFDVYDQNQRNTWALAKKDDLGRIQVVEVDANGKKVEPPNWKIQPPDGQAQTPEWIITPLAAKTFLNPGESVWFKLSQVRTDLRSGGTNVYLRYENINGFRDGALLATLEKTGAVGRDQTDGNGQFLKKSYVGIGTNKPLGRLHAVGEGGFGSEDADGKSLAAGNVPIIVQSNSTAFGIINGFGRQAFALNIDSAADTGQRRGMPTFYDKFDGQWRSSLSLKNGNVGIGIEPTAKLHVSGDAIINNNLSIPAGSLSVSGGNLSVSGNLGVGATDTGVSKLKVANGTSDFAHVRFATGGCGELEFVGWGAGWNINTKTSGKNLYINRDTSGDVLIGSVGKELIVKGDSGGIGIGTGRPAARLTIETGDTDCTSYAAGKAFFVSCPMRDGRNRDGAIEFRHDNLSQGIGFGYNTIYATGYNDNQDLALQSKGGGKILLNPSGGFVGVGTDSPGAPLHVAPNASMYHGVNDQYAYYAFTWNAHSDNTVNIGLSGRFGGGTTFPNVSICAEGRVIGTEFNAFSDSRIKSDLSVSESETDLNLLKQLKVTDYRYKDFIAYGNKAIKGFIAEEVERIFPQAVNRCADFIPDIYAFAEETTLDDGVLQIRLAETHNLAAGDTVRLIMETVGVREVGVEIVDEKTFSVSDWQESSGKTFVHGKKVEDFRTLDYQQIFTLGISGLQQLSKKVEKLEASNFELKKKLDFLENNLKFAAKRAV